MRDSIKKLLSSPNQEDNILGLNLITREEALEILHRVPFQDNLQLINIYFHLDKKLHYFRPVVARIRRSDYRDLKLLTYENYPYEYILLEDVNL